MVKDHLNELKTGELPKGRFIGMYTQKLNSIDRDNAFRFKRYKVFDPQLMYIYKQLKSNKWV